MRRRSRTQKKWRHCVCKDEVPKKTHIHTALTRFWTSLIPSTFSHCFSSSANFWLSACTSAHSSWGMHLTWKHTQETHIHENRQETNTTHENIYKTQVHTEFRWWHFTITLNNIYETMTERYVFKSMASTLTQSSEASTLLHMRLHEQVISHMQPIPVLLACAVKSSSVALCLRHRQYCAISTITVLCCTVILYYTIPCDSMAIFSGCALCSPLKLFRAHGPACLRILLSHVHHVVCWAVFVLRVTSQRFSKHLAVEKDTKDRYAKNQLLREGETWLRAGWNTILIGTQWHSHYDTMHNDYVTWWHDAKC